MRKNKRDESDMEKTAEKQNEELSKMGRIPWKAFGRFLIFRIPIWMILTVVVATGSFCIYRRITRVEPANLRPIVTNAHKLEVTLTVCDDVLKDNKLEVFEAEEKLAKRFSDTEKVRKVRVRIDRAPENQCE